MAIEDCRRAQNLDYRRAQQWKGKVVTAVVLAFCFCCTSAVPDQNPTAPTDSALAPATAATAAVPAAAPVPAAVALASPTAPMTLAALATPAAPASQAALPPKAHASSVYVPQGPSEAQQLLYPGSPATAKARVEANVTSPVIPIAENRAAAGAYLGGVEPTIWKKPAILLIGDSITEMGLNPDGGWTVRVASAYSRKVDIINRGFGGYTTATTLLALPEILDSVKNQRVILATVWLGANDASMPDRNNSAASVPIEAYVQNLISIVQQLQGAGVMNVVVVTPPPVYEDAPQALAPDQILPNRTYKWTAFYAAAARAVGNQLQIQTLDMWDVVDSYDGWQTKLMLPDGLHLNPAGQEVAYNAFMIMVDTVIPEVKPASLPWHHPTWWFIDYKNAAQQFNSELAAYERAR